MGFTRSATNLNIIAALADLPNGIGGLTAAQLKAEFDKGALALQTALNALMAELEKSTDGTSASERLGSGTITGVTGSTVYAQISNLKAQVDAVVLGTVTDDSLTDAKLKAGAGTIKNRVVALQKFPTATGAATAIAVACDYFALTDGAQMTFVASGSNSSAATTLAANGLTAKPVYKPGGTAAPAIVSGKAYTVWYNLAGDCFFVKASAEGTATAANVLAGGTFSNDSDVGISGTMVDRSGDTVALVTATAGTTFKFKASEGYRDGVNDYVTQTDANRVAGNIRLGVTLDGIPGAFPAPATIGNIIVAGVEERASYADAYTKKIDIQMLYGGTFRVFFYLHGTPDTVTAYGKVYVDDVAVGTELAVVGVTPNFTTEYITITAGQHIQLYMYRTPGVSNFGNVTGFVISAASNPICTVVL